MKLKGYFIKNSEAIFAQTILCRRTMNKILIIFTLLYFPVFSYPQDAPLGNTNSDIGSAEEHSSRYRRADYLPSWADADGDCINTRHEVLITESRIPVTMSKNGCSVLKGEWLDRATNQIFTNPADVDIDHTVALSEAHRSGASNWSTERKREFSNDLINSSVLEVMDDGVNSLKGDKDPAEWLPPNEQYHCTYIRNWVEIKNLYELTFDEKEKVAIEKVLGRTDDLCEP